jgi:2-keto-4-pentenoate hydratase/2-oxohepta-3-ene-1,7-dioic acid hydratase in catechol pathway
MKLVRWGEAGAEKAGLLDDSGSLRDLSGTAADWSWQTLTSETLAQVGALDAISLPALPADTRLGAPVSRPGKIVGCALTYGKHAAEAGMDAPEEPMFMLTAASAVNDPNEPVMMPQGGSQLDWEAELAVVFCKAGANIAVENAMSHVAGFCVGNDVSERVFQLERGTQWAKGKSADTLKPLAPGWSPPMKLATPTSSISRFT